jgi:hypothetical protein
MNKTAFLKSSPQQTNTLKRKEAYIDKLLELKTGIMAYLLTGRVRINKYDGVKYNVNESNTIIYEAINSE